VIAVDFDGVVDNGSWQPHDYEGGFEFAVTPGELSIVNRADVNQHLVRRGTGIDATRPYAIEGLFVVPVATDGSGLNSFCFNLCVGGADADLTPPSTWAMNVDFNAVSPGGVMKHMGFVGGRFAEIGQTTVAWATQGTEYLLHMEVGRAMSGALDPDRVTVEVRDRGVVVERFDVDYASFPFQPNRSRPVRLGVNTHGTDWKLRSLRAYYLD
jgi:hypothetical protein